MLTLRPYQEKAVERLLDDTYSLLARDVWQQVLLLEAPTGAGKTVMMAEFLRRLTEELPTNDDVPAERRQVAFVWIAPGHLHLQSYTALRRHFEETRTVRPVQWSDLPDNHLYPGDLLFLNWQSIDNERKLLVRDNEQQRNLAQLVQRTKLRGTELVVICDEAHLFVYKGLRARNALRQLQAVVEIDVTATPNKQERPPRATVTVQREAVVRAQMIKRGVVLNPALDATTQQGEALNVVLLKQALAKRDELADRYRAQGVTLNPLLLIQLPSEGAKESVLDRTIHQTVVAWLDAQCGISTANGRLAVWLANEKKNRDGLEAPTSPVEVLLFKQAIALGWDCPRAAVLLIFRELTQEAFTIQTVGRILRMPEQRHYPDEALNLGYVFTDLARDAIRIEPDSADYLSLNQAARRPDYQDLGLTVQYVANERDERNRLGGQFRRWFYAAAEQRWGVSRDLRPDGQTPYDYNLDQLRASGVRTDVDKVEIAIPADVLISAVEVGSTPVDGDHRQRFAKTQFELGELLRRFCQNHCGPYAKAESTPVLMGAFVMLFEEYFQRDEKQALRLILAPDNQLEMTALIVAALELYATKMAEKARTTRRTVETAPWEVPATEIYTDHYQEFAAPAHVLQPTYLRRRPDGNLTDSKEELAFVQFLEDDLQRRHLRWWFKNGAGTRTDFAVAYQKTERGELRWAPFYPDFLVLFRNGTLGVFDVKTSESDLEAPAKHNALHAWVAARNAQQPNSTAGGILIRQSGLWRYPEVTITHTADQKGWQVLNPALFSGAVAVQP